MQDRAYQNGTRSASEWERVQARLGEKGYELWQSAQDEWLTFCPEHEHSGPHHPSFSITVKPDGKVLTYCFACEEGYYLRIVDGDFPECTATEAWHDGGSGGGTRTGSDGGRSVRVRKRRRISKIELQGQRPDMAHLVAEWSWQVSAEDDGFPVEEAQYYYDGGKYCKVRWSDKGFGWYTRVGDTWRWGLNGVPGLYGADRLEPGEGMVLCVEGERDVDTAWEQGLPAVSTHYAKGRNARNIAEAMLAIPVEWSRRKTVVVIPDNDIAGKGKAQKFADAVKDAALMRGIKILEPLGSSRGFDLTDYFRGGGTREQLIAVMTEAPWMPGAEPGAAPPPEEPPAAAQERAEYRPELDVTNLSEVADWLREHLGKEGEPLAGIFIRNGELVFTPRENEEGYVPLTDKDQGTDGPAQVRPMSSGQLHAWMQYLYRCYRERTTKKGEVTREYVLPPLAPAKMAVDAPQAMKNVRVLNGVVHTPVVRADGSITERAGYDIRTRLLYLPEPGTEDAVLVSSTPSGDELIAARELVLKMIVDFPWVSDNDRANYLGMLLTPVLRQLAPPPYKLCAIAAHQPGSGKTLLARLLRIIHGGVFRSEMPGDEAEFGKQVTSILSITTGMVVIFDNVSGVLKSPKLAGLLTSAQWDDRPLGRTEWMACTNDRLWVITGNNVKIGGDLSRRTIHAAIDPGMPNPETRTDFEIMNLESWVEENRGELLRALLTLVRHWVAVGSPVKEQTSSDSYGTWVQIVNGVLAAAGIEGEFDHLETRLESTVDQEWAHFLEAVYEGMGEETWTARELLEQVSFSGALQLEGKLFHADILPGDIGEKMIRGGSEKNLTSASKSLGHWLSNHEGRWAGGYVVRKSDVKKARAVQWRIVKASKQRTIAANRTNATKALPLKCSLS